MASDPFLAIKDVDPRKIRFDIPRGFGTNDNKAGISAFMDVDGVKKRSKIVIKTPKMLLPFGCNKDANGNYYLLASSESIPEIHNEREIKEIMRFFEDIEDACETFVSQKHAKWGIKKYDYRSFILDGDDQYTNKIYFPLRRAGDKILAGLFDDTGKKIEIGDFSVKCVVKMALELSYLYYHPGTSTFRTKWNVMQVLKCQFVNDLHYSMMESCFLVDAARCATRRPPPPIIHHSLPPPPPTPNKPAQKANDTSFIGAAPPSAEQILEGIAKMKARALARSKKKSARSVVEIEETKSESTPKKSRKPRS